MKFLTDALHWVFATEQKVLTMTDTVIDSAATSAAAVDTTTAVGIPAVAVATTDPDVLIAQLKALLVTAGVDVSVYDSLAAAAKALATK